MKARKIISGGCVATIIASAIILLVGCAANPGVTPVPPVIVDQSDCQAACDNLNHLNCDDGKDIDMKLECANNSECSPGQNCSPVTKTCVAPCLTFCIDTENKGVWLDPKCVAQITSCDQIENCPLSTPKTAGVGKSNVARDCDDVSCQINL